MKTNKLKRNLLGQLIQNKIRKKNSLFNNVCNNNVLIYCVINIKNAEFITISV